MSRRLRLMSTTHYVWRIEAHVNDNTVWVVPHSDPWEYEHAADGVFATRAEAANYLIEWEFEEVAVKERWVLMHVTTQLETSAEELLARLKNDPLQSKEG